MSQIVTVTETREELAIAFKSSEKLPGQLDRFIGVMQRHFGALVQENQRLREEIVASESRKHEMEHVHREKLANLTLKEGEHREERTRLLKEAEGIVAESEVRLSLAESARVDAIRSITQLGETKVAALQEELRAVRCQLAAQRDAGSKQREEALIERTRAVERATLCREGEIATLRDWIAKTSAWTLDLEKQLLEENRFELQQRHEAEQRVAEEKARFERDTEKMQSFLDRYSEGGFFLYQTIQQRRERAKAWHVWGTSVERWNDEREDTFQVRLRVNRLVRPWVVPPLAKEMEQFCQEREKQWGRKLC